MPPKIQKSKAAKLLAAQSASKSKGKKKKWSKGKVREKKTYRVVFNKATLDKFMSDVPKKMKTITIYNLVENFKINCSLARRGIQELLKKNLIIPVLSSGTYCIYTKNPKLEKEEKKEAPAAGGKAAKKGQQQPKGKKGKDKAAAEGDAE